MPSIPLKRSRIAIPTASRPCWPKSSWRTPISIRRNTTKPCQAYKEFEKLHPTNKAVPYCVYRQGLCYYRQRSTIDRDQTYTTKALEEFRRLKTEVPPDANTSPRRRSIMAQCRRDLGEHEYYIAEFYFKTKRYQAALERYQVVAQEYPEFPKKAEVKEHIEECQKILATADKKPQGGFFSPIANLFDAKW